MATRTAGEIIKEIDGGLRRGHDKRIQVDDEFANALWELYVIAKKG